MSHQLVTLSGSHGRSGGGVAGATTVGAVPVLVATINPKPGMTDEVIAAFEEVIPEVHNEEGCELYALHRQGDTLVMIEKWSTDEALAAHGQGESLKALGRKLRELTADRGDLKVMQALPMGEASKGAL